MSDNKELEIATHTSWTAREMQLLSEALEEGVKPISKTLMDKMYSVFLEGYTVEEVVSAFPGFTEKDILVCRHRNQWDDKKERYLQNLANQAQLKITKSKLEGIDFLTNMLSAIHKTHNQSLVKFFASGDSEDLPKIGSMKQYKDLIEILQKITGEDKTQKLNINQKIESMINVSSGEMSEKDIVRELIKPENAAKILDSLTKKKQDE